MNNDLCPHCGAALHFNDEVGMFCPACAQQKDAMQAAWEATRRDANEAAKQRRASDIALAATEAERVARALRGEQMPPPFAVCEGHEKRLAALEGRVAALEGYHNELEAALGAFCDATAQEAAPEPVSTICPVVTRVEVRDHFGRCLFFAAPANDVDLRYSDDGKTLTVVLRR